MNTTAHLQALLERHRAGHPDALNSLLDHSHGRLRVLAGRMFRRYPDLRALDQTDDVVSKAVIRLHKSLANIRPETVRAYLAIAARQIRWVLLDLAREQRDRRITYVEDVPERPGREGEPRTLAEWAEFHAVVSRLPDPQRELFDLLVYQGLEQTEAAALLGMSVRTLKRRWQEARLALAPFREGM